MSDTNNLLADEEFTRLSPVPSVQDLEGLRHSLPVIETWRGYVVYNVHVFNFCRENRIYCKYKELAFNSRAEVMIFVCDQILNEKITQQQHHYTVGKMYGAYKKYFADEYPVANQFTNAANRRPYNQSEKKSYTAAYVGERYYLSAGTVSRYGSYAFAIDQIFDKVPAIAYRILSEEFDVSMNVVFDLSELPKEQIQAIYNRVIDSKDDQLVYKELRRFCSIKAITRCQRKRKTEAPEIKQMPKYDPDAEISSLSLTIPMWISSINRTRSISHFDEASIEAKVQLLNKLDELQHTIKCIKRSLKEEHHERR